MFKNPYFYGERGCLWWTIEIGLFVYAVICLIVEVNTAHAWWILGIDVLDILLYILGRWIERKRYYREDSFWLRKDDPDDQPKDENGI